MIQSKPLLAWLGLFPESSLDFKLLGQGEYNCNYLFHHPATGEKLVLRINHGSQMLLSNQIGYEYAALKALAPSGRTPKPLFCDPVANLLVMEWLPGRPLDYRTDMDTAAQILADIHCTPLPDPCPLIRPAAPAQAIYQECLEMVQHYFTWEEADPEICALLRTLVEEMGRLPLFAPSDAPLCMVNTELNSGNFLINPQGTSYLVDWEKPLVSEPAQDLGHFLAPTTTFWKTDVILTPAEVRHFVNCYIRAVDGRMDTSTLSQRLPLYFTITCLRGITWCAMALREYSQPGRALMNPDTFAKLKAYIHPEFLTNILENYLRKDFL